MTHGLRRGSTVAYGPHFGVVWTIDGGVGDAAPKARKKRRDERLEPVVLCPIFIQPRRSFASDVVLDMAELIAAGIERPGAIIRASSLQEHTASAVMWVGELQGAALCRFVAGVARAIDDATVRARYVHGDRHRRQNAEARPVKMHD